MLLISAAVYACPTVATGTVDSLDFDVAQVAIVHQDGLTTFSVSINPFGDKQSFALVLPVPEVLQADQIRTLDGGIFATLDAATAPRHVMDAGCVQPESGGGCSWPFSQEYDLAKSAAGSTTGTVEVEASYLVGEYEVTILSAEESSGLQAWLDTNGYHLPEGAEPLLAEYIDNGQYFLAARVAEEAAEADGSPLSPLQISYASDVFGIPIRLSTLNSPGVQDLVIYAIGDRTDGAVGIANYDTFTVPNGCVWGDPNFDDFGGAYQDLFTEAWEDVGDAAWATEFAGGPYDCNPCTGVWPDDEQMATLGYDGNPWDPWVTRLHLRYTPEQATEELAMYASGITTPQQLSYADDTEANRTCIEKFCDGSATPEADAAEGSCGTSPTRAGLGLAAIALVAAVFRRRTTPVCL